MLKKAVVSKIDQLVYKKLTVGQKERLSNMLTDSQKDFLRIYLGGGKHQQHVKKISRYKDKLTTQGFTWKAESDLYQIYEETENENLKKLAAYELILHHGNQKNASDLIKMLGLAKELLESEKDTTRLRRLIIMIIEAYHKIGENEKAAVISKRLLEATSHPDAWLAHANLKSDIKDKANVLTEVYRQYNEMPILFEERADTLYLYDRLTTPNIESDNFVNEGPKVSVIMPAYNAENTIKTSLESLLKQTWNNIEIIVVDDCSTDATVNVIEKYKQKDDRIICLSTGVNSGAYVARNIGLGAVSGEYVTVNDADDWSHPRKIELQVRHLIENPSYLGNFSKQARLSNNLFFYRRGKLGTYLFTNFSSLMFKRTPVLKKLGYWDSVRFAGDSEFVQRFKLIFGEQSLYELDTPPMSFQRQSEGSLTANSAFGFPGYFMGARKEYRESHFHYHRNNPESLHYDFPQIKRPFPIPEPMSPKRVKGKRRHFDVIIASEFRLTGGTNMSNLEEIKAHKLAGLKTGLVQVYRYDLFSAEEINPRVRDIVDGESVEMIVYGEDVTCDTLIIRHPPVFMEEQQYLPKVTANRVKMIVNQPPKREYSETGETLYRLERTNDLVMKWINKEPLWYPIGPAVRKALNDHHRDELDKIQLSQHDWVNIINVKEWESPLRMSKGKQIVIGRHSRDQYVKWPETKEELLEIYPDKGDYKVKVLGGAASVKDKLGKIPSNWTVYQFGEISPQQFLEEIDVFVYYTHSKWVEAFGRVIFEAMAARVPVILPPQFEEVFGDAAIYAENHEAIHRVNDIMNCPNEYISQVEKAKDYVETHFGYNTHLERLYSDE